MSCARRRRASAQGGNPRCDASHRPEHGLALTTAPRPRGGGPPSPPNKRLFDRPLLAAIILPPAQISFETPPNLRSAVCPIGCARWEHGPARRCLARQKNSFCGVYWAGGAAGGVSCPWPLGEAPPTLATHGWLLGRQTNGATVGDVPAPEAAPSAPLAQLARPPTTELVASFSPIAATQSVALA